jgi:FkbM family methyltransferase
MLDVARTHSKTVHGQTFNFAEVRGYGDADHASVWTFDDEQQFRDRWWSPAKGETVLDIGAAFGSYALPALARGARVVCFSPADFDTSLLEANLALNPDLARRCLVVRDGLHSNDGWFNPDKCLFDHEAREGRAPWLHVRSLDSFLDERPGIERVDWMKLDVEGAELEVLKGGEKCIRMYRPRILVENHEQHVPGISDAVRDYLVGLGFGYVCDGPYQYGVVSHSYYEAR